MFSTWAYVRNGAILSAIGHLVLAAGVLGVFAHPALFVTNTEPVTVDIVSPKDVPQLDLSKFDIPDFDTGQTKAQKPEVAKPAPQAAPSAPPAAQSTPPAAQPAPQAPQAEPPPAKPEPQGQATLTPPAQSATPQSIFAATQIPALLDLVTPATSAGLAPLAEVPADITAADIATFKAHLRKCWSPPAGLSGDPKLKVVLRVFLARNGALAQQPVLMAASASTSGPALVQTATTALHRCAPFNFLPADRYKEWRVLDLTLTIGDMGGG